MGDPYRSVIYTGRRPYQPAANVNKSVEFQSMFRLLYVQP